MITLLYTELGEITTLSTVEELRTGGNGDRGTSPSERFLRLTFCKSHKNTDFALELQPF